MAVTFNGYGLFLFWRIKAAVTSLTNGLGFLVLQGVSARIVEGNLFGRRQ